METKQSIVQLTGNNLKFSFKLAINNFFSFLLAVIGIGIIFVVVVAAVSIPILFIVLSSFDLSQLGVVIPEAGIAFSEFFILQSVVEGNFFLAAALGLLIGIPSVAIGTAFIGPLYGMSKELVESGDTTAENAFSWLRQKFVPFALAGIGIMLLLIIPPGLMYLGAYYLLGISLPMIYQRILVTISSIWFFLAYGVICTVLPAVADGQSVNDSFKTAINLTRSNWKRVYGLLLGYAAIALVFIGPAIIPTLFWDPAFLLPSLTNPLISGILVYIAIGALILVFLGIPAHMISVTRLYMVLTGKETYDPEHATEPEISLMGG